MRIFAFHLLNDFSGSPKVLRQVIMNWQLQDVELHLATSLRTEGFLSGLNKVRYHDNKYVLPSGKWRRLWRFLASQFYLFFYFLFKIKSKDIVYINTILPFSAALLGKLKGCRVIYHVHETSVSPVIFKWFLLKMAGICADDIIYVSKYLSDQKFQHNAKEHILYNALEESFLRQAEQNRVLGSSINNVLMVCSLRAYKGVNEFVKLAEDNPGYKFRLVMNASEEDIADYFKTGLQPPNLEMYSTQKDLHPFYSWADIIVNLSRPKEWIETFGLTIIEGMAYGLPAIVPPVGGIAELVEEGFNGYRVNSLHTGTLNEKLNEVLSDPEHYMQLREKVLKRIKNYSEAAFCHKHDKIISIQS